MGRWRDYGVPGQNPTPGMQHYSGPMLSPLPTRNLIGRFEADNPQGTTASNGTNVTFWRDQSPTGMDLATPLTLPPGPPYAPVYYTDGPNGKPRINFKGIPLTSTLNCPLSGDPGMTICAIVRINNANPSAICGGGSFAAGSGQSWCLGHDLAAGLMSVEGNPFRYASIPDIATGSWQCVTYQKNPGACNISSAFYSGRVNSATATNVSSPNIASGHPFAIGAWGDYTGADVNNGDDIAAVYVYAVKLTTGELAQLWNYLQKYIPAL